VKFQHKSFFLRCHLPSFKTRVEIINPSQPATFSRPVQTYNKTRLLKVVPLQNHPSPYIHTYYVSPATFKPDTFAIKSHRRSPNKCTKLISSMSSFSVHGPFRISSCIIFFVSLLPASSLCLISNLQLTFLLVLGGI